jgi:hypothetical protein
MEKLKSRLGIEILTAQIHAFIARSSEYTNERVINIFSRPGGVPAEIQEIFKEIQCMQASIESALFDRNEEEFKASAVEMLVFCDEVIHFGLAVGYFEENVCDFLAMQLYLLDVAPYDSLESGLNYIQTKLDEAAPDGLWTVSACTCDKCLGSDSPSVQIHSEFEEENEDAASMMLAIAISNADKNLQATVEYEKTDSQALNWLKPKAQKQ